MRPLSATECISPAIDRMKLVLFSPFRKGRTWKLCATANLGRYGTAFIPIPLLYLAALPAFAARIGTLAVVAICIGALFVTAIFAFFFYLFSRLEFANFDIVLNLGQFVAPAWRRHGRQSLKWTSFKLLLGTGVTLLCAAPIALVVRQAIPHLSELQMTPGQPPSPQFFAFMGAFYGVYFLFLIAFGLFYLVSSLLADFILPSLALENTTLGEAFRRMSALIRREPGAFGLYALLKVVLGLAGYLGATLVWEIGFSLLVLVVGGVFALIGFLLHAAGVSAAILTVVAVVLGVPLVLVLMYYTLFLVTGPVLMFLDAYSLYFLGGRYPLLGELLERSAPPAPPIRGAVQPAYAPPSGELGSGV
jgi:hypothetical protein